MNLSYTIIINRSQISLGILLFSLIFFVIGLTSLIYLLSLLMCVLWLKSFSKKEMILLVFILLIILILLIGNLFILHNYIDLTLKGLFKLLVFSTSAIAYKKFFVFAIKYQLTHLRIILWIAFILSLFIKSGIDLQSMQQLMIINLVFISELYSFIHKNSRLSFYVIVILLILTIKKQLWFSALFMLLLLKPALIKVLTIIIIICLFVIFTFGGIGTQKVGTASTELRLNSFLSERFITPDPYGNMRLFLVIILVPKVMEYNFILGYGLERYGSITAYESNRDVERQELGMDNFISKDYNGNSIFDAVAADVGFLTILMQMGLLGVLLYILLLLILGTNFKITLMGFMILSPYFLGGPIVYSLGFPIIVSLVYSILLFSKRKT